MLWFPVGSLCAAISCYAMLLRCPVFYHPLSLPPASILEPFFDSNLSTANSASNKAPIVYPHEPRLRHAFMLFSRHYVNYVYFRFVMHESQLLKLKSHLLQQRKHSERYKTPSQVRRPWHSSTQTNPYSSVQKQASMKVYQQPCFRRQTEGYNRYTSSAEQ